MWFYYNSFNFQLKLRFTDIYLSISANFLSAEYLKVPLKVPHKFKCCTLYYSPI